MIHSLTLSATGETPPTESVDGFLTVVLARVRQGSQAAEAAASTTMLLLTSPVLTSPSFSSPLTWVGNASVFHDEHQSTRSPTPRQECEGQANSNGQHRVWKSIHGRADRLSQSSGVFEKVKHLLDGLMFFFFLRVSPLRISFFLWRPPQRKCWARIGRLSFRSGVLCERAAVDRCFVMAQRWRCGAWVRRVSCDWRSWGIVFDRKPKGEMGQEHTYPRLELGRQGPRKWDATRPRTRQCAIGLGRVLRGHSHFCECGHHSGVLLTSSASMMSCAMNMCLCMRGPDR